MSSEASVSSKRSGRLLSDVRTTEVSAQSEQNRRESTPSSRPGHSAYLQDNDIDFMTVLHAAVRRGVPSISIDIERENTQSQRAEVTLGTGLTSQVIQYSLAEDSPTSLPRGAVVALKTFGRTSQDKVARKTVHEHILQEIYLLRHSKLAGHPNIIQLHFIAWRKGEAFPALALELADHGSLDYLIRSFGEGLKYVHKQHITIDIALGLHAIHQAGFSHGDLKPENIIIMNHPDETRQVVAKLIDFGGSLQAATHMGGGPVHFTPLWCAPEVLNKDPDVDWEKADVYSYGLVIGSLWANGQGRGGYGSKKSSKSSSCFLAECLPSFLSKAEEEELLWVLKCEDQKSRNSGMFALQEMLEAAVEEVADRSDLVQILVPALKPHFWSRPGTGLLAQNLEPLSQRLGRNISTESSIGEDNQDREVEAVTNVGTKSGTFSWSFTEDYKDVIIEQSTVALMDRGYLDQLTEDVLDLPEVLPADLTTRNYFQHLSDVVNELMGSGLKNYSDFEKKLSGAKLAFYIAFLSLVRSKAASNVDKFTDMIRVSALGGNSLSICLASLTFNNTDMESHIPIRAFLSLLALSGSDWASQVLFDRWPTHYKFINDAIRSKPDSYMKSKHQLGVHENPFMISTLSNYRAEATSHPLVSLDQMINLSALDDIYGVLEGNFVPEDLNESIGGLLHRLSHLPDSEAAKLVPLAYRKGARLGLLEKAESAIAGGAWLSYRISDGDPPVSPLSASLRRGKSELAMAIFCLHVEAGEAIRDFSSALVHSVIYLQHDVCNVLLSLYDKSPHMCYDAQTPWSAAKQPLSELLSHYLTESNICDLERRALHGGNYNNAYESTLKVLMDYGASATDGLVTNCPLWRALQWDDEIAVKVFVQALKDRQIDVLPHLKDPGNMLQDPDLSPYSYTALATCLKFKSIECFQFLLRRFPVLAAEVTNDQVGTTILHEACGAEQGIAFVRALVNTGSNLTAMKTNGTTPLSQALSSGNIEAAELIAEHCSETQLVLSLSRNLEAGHSAFFDLISIWPHKRNSRVLEGFKWLARNNGAYIYGPGGNPAWFRIVGATRPFREADRRLDVELMKILLDTDNLTTRIDEERWNGMTVLQHAAGNGHLEVVSLLLDRGCNPNAHSVSDVPVELQKACLPNAIDPTRISYTALDFVCIRLMGVSVPPEVIQSGYLEAQKWSEDLETLRTLLVLKGGHSFIYESYKLLMNYEAPAIEGLHPNVVPNVLVKDGKVLTGSWPKPIVDIPKGPAPSSLEDVLANTKWRDEAFYNVMRSEMQQKSMERYREREKTRRQPNYLKMLKLEARVKKVQWRLPPDWYGLIIADEPGEDSGHMVLYANKKTRHFTTERPGLYSGDRGTPGGKESKAADLTDEDDPSHALPMFQSAMASGERESKGDVSSGLTDRPSDSELPVAQTQTPLIKHHSGPSTSKEETNKTGAYIVMFNGTIAQIPSDLVHYTLDNGATFLHLAIELGNIKLMQYLIRAGADVNGQTLEGYLPLHVCIVTGDKPELLQVMLDERANVNARGPEGSPLLMAIKRGYEKSVELLLSAGACLDADELLLHAAARNGNVKIAEMLLDREVDINQRDPDSAQTPLFTAIAYGQAEMLNMLASRGAAHKVCIVESILPKSDRFRSSYKLIPVLGHPDMNPTEMARIPPLQIAVGLGDEILTRRLLEDGHDPNDFDVRFATPLCTAVTSQSHSLVKLLLAHEARIDLTDANGWTSLHIAQHVNSVDLLQLLLEKGGDINSETFDGDTLLKHAVRDNHLEAAKLLLAHGADPNISNVYGVSPLLFSVLQNEVQLIKFLLDYGADPNATATISQMAQAKPTTSASEDDIGQQAMSFEQIAFFRRGGATCVARRTQSPISYAVAAKLEGPLRLLLSACDQITWTDMDGGNILHYAILLSNERILKMLLEKSGMWSHQSTNSLGETPLHIAAQDGLITAARALLDAGHEIDARDNSFSTPLTEALFHWKKEMIDFLLERGADASVAREFGIDSSNGQSSLVHVGTAAKSDFYKEMGLTPLTNLLSSGSRDQQVFIGVSFEANLSRYYTRIE